VNTDLLSLSDQMVGWLVSTLVRRQRQLKRCGSQTNKYDFHSFGNVENDRDESQMASGRLFQVRGPAMANDLSPNEVHVRGTWNFPVS